jgi:glycosyltransferase involved in cell wall biosynthesis
VAVLPVAAAAARRLRAPLVVTIHCSLRHTLAVTGARSAFLRAVGGTAEIMTVRRAAAVITLTERLAGALRDSAVPAERLHPIPSGVRLDRFGAAAAPAGLPRPAVVYVGRLHRQKGLDTLLRAVARLPGVQAVLVGDGPQRGALQRLAAGLGVAGRLHVTGFVPHSEVAGMLAAADVVVLPSRYEELGTSLLEAMAAGRPVVASRVGGIPEVVRDGADGLLVPARDEAALASAISRLLRDAPLAESLARSARARAASYDWRGLAQRVAGVYRAVLGQG